VEDVGLSLEFDSAGCGLCMFVVKREWTGHQFSGNIRL